MIFMTMIHQWIILDVYKRQMMHVAREYLGAGVCAADLAGAEAAYPMSGFMELFKYTKQLGMPFTIHAGAVSYTHLDVYKRQFICCRPETIVFCKIL